MALLPSTFGKRKAEDQHYSQYVGVILTEVTHAQRHLIHLYTPMNMSTLVIVASLHAKLALTPFIVGGIQKHRSLA